MNIMSIRYMHICIYAYVIGKVRIGLKTHSHNMLIEDIMVNPS